ncbi:MAG: putative thioredoxin [Solirubrobacteraceae bacterium]|jgi:putative thioredoxin|nr:putative thioredoxin [Solirubrobacteraceae bacterium]
MVIDVAEQDFEREVIDRSRSVPVVVDFWAEWCGPCRTLTPALERAAQAREGKVVLAKVDTDKNPGLSRTYRVQGIPAVKAFKDGQVVEEFVGVQPPAAVERFFDGLVPSEADRLVALGDEPSLRQALELQPGRGDAAVPLARMLHARGEDDPALALLKDVPGSFAADGLRARIELEAAADPSLEEAFGALDAGDRERALARLIAALAQADGSRDLVRQVVVGVLDELGPDSALAREYRRRLAAALY